MKRALLLCLLIAPWALGADSSALEILKRTAATYRSLQGYEFRVTVQTVRGANVSEQHLTESGSKPGLYRIQDQDPNGELRLGDGRMEWVFSPRSNQYTSSPLAAETQTRTSALAEIDQHVKSAGIAREEQFLADGKRIGVYVVRVARDQWPRGSLAGAEYAMYRIDKQTFAVHKAITYSPGATQIVLYSIAKWNQAVPETLFVFKPPASARAVSSVDAPSTQPAPIVGTAAPDFTLPDLEGRPVSLRSLRGKVVIVDFWATWCGPCQALMPKLQQMHRELSGKGLKVLGLDIGEDAATVAKFAKHNSYTFPLLLGAEPDVSAKYFVEAYPTTFVIDRQGWIAFREMGGASADELRSAVEKALQNAP